MIWNVFSWFADHLTILHGLGILAGASGIAAYLLIPGAAPVFAFLGGMLSMLLGNRVGVGILALAIGLYVGILFATHKADLACDAKVAALMAQSEKDAADRDDAIAAQLNDKYTPILAQLQSQDDALQKQVEADAAQINKKPHGACQLGVWALRMRGAH